MRQAQPDRVKGLGGGFGDSGAGLPGNGHTNWLYGYVNAADLVHKPNILVVPLPFYRVHAKRVGIQYILACRFFDPWTLGHAVAQW